MSVHILLNGASGRMGQAISSICTDYECEISCPIDLGDDPNDGLTQCAVVIDFSVLIFLSHRPLCPRHAPGIVSKPSWLTTACAIRVTSS